MSTTQAPLLWVPLKSTSDVSYAPSIRQTISQTYQESADAYKEEIAALDRCRQDALRGSAGSDVTGRDLLYKYFGQLELLELRFPEVRVPFPWKDAFTGKEISQLSLAYEKASVIFNIAATLSSLAAQQNRTSTEGIRRAFHNFRCAAGMFTYINDNFLHAPSTDLSREVVKVLVQLMIAQATEVFVERMTEEKEKKPFGLRARVSTQAAFLYGSVLEDVKELANKGIFERSWTWLIQCKHKYFVSLAQYQRSLADSASSKHGDALTRLHIAEAAAKEAHRFAASFSAAFTTINGSGSATLPSDAPFSLLELTKTHLALCVEAKVSEQRDNDLIYHDAQPSEAALPAIEKSSVGDPIAIQEVYGAPEVQKVVGQDIFIRLVPLSVHQSSSLYSEEKAKLVRTEGERCEMADTELSTALDFMGLPASLGKFKDLLMGTGRSTRLDELTDPPVQVSEWAEAVQQAMDTKPIESLWEHLTSLRDNTHRDLVNVERNLDSDARDCEQMRVKYDHLWEQQPSSNLTKAWRHSIKSHRETLEAARKSDNQVDGIWKPARADIDILADKSGESLRRLFAESICAQQDTTNGVSLLDVGETSDEEAELTQMGNMLTAIQENITRLQALKKERQGVLKDLKERIQADDISQLLILNRKAQNIEPALFAAELEKFRAHSGRISATLHLQTTAIQELTAQYKSLSESKRGKDLQDRWTNASKKRTQATSRFQRAYEAHDEVRSGLSKGIQFYQEIQAAVAELQRQVEGFVSSRATERMRMATKAEAERDRNANDLGEMKPLEHQMAGMNIGDRSASSVPSPLPPPLPPQPRAWQTAPTNSPAGPAYQTFPSYGPGSEQTHPHPSQPMYASPSPSVPYSSPAPPGDPYASLGAFGSMFPPAQPATQATSPAVQQYQAPPPPHQQYPGPSQPLAPVPQQYPATAQAPPQQYAGQSQIPPHAQQYAGQPPTGPAASQPYSGPSYGPYGAPQGPPDALGAPAVPPKHVLPPPPPPVTYQTTVAQPYRASQAYTSSALPPSTHHAHPHAPSSVGPQQYSPAPSPQAPPAPGHQQYHHPSPGSRPTQQYMGPSSQTYGHPTQPSGNGGQFGSAAHHQLQQQYGGGGHYQGAQGDRMSSLAGPAGGVPGSAGGGGVWQQNHEQHHQNPYPPPPPPHSHHLNHSQPSRPGY